MKPPSIRTLVVLLLGAFLALGLSLSAVQAHGMAVKMAASAAMDGADQGGCDGCGDGGDGNATVCAAACTTTSVAVLPAAVTQKVLRSADVPLPAHLASRSRFSSPDPYPPKPRDLK